MTETTIPGLLEALGGKCKKTAICEPIRSHLALSRAKTRAAIEAAIENGSIVMSEELIDTRKTLVLTLPAKTEATSDDDLGETPDTTE